MNNRISELELEPYVFKIDQVRAAISQVIVGQAGMTDLLIAGMLANGHVLIEGVPGVAKTLAARLVAKLVSADFRRIQFTPDLMPSDVVGTSIYNPKTTMFEFRPGPIFSNFVLIDEVNRAPAKTQSALFEVMEERQVTIDGVTYPMQSPFLVFATQNPIEHEGTYRLPEAQLDRFLLIIEVDYPDLEAEIQIITKHNLRLGKPTLEHISPVLATHELLELQAVVQKIYIEPQLIRYIALLIHNTRNNSALYLAASPRASLALLNASKAIALINGRNFVIPEDIKAVIYPVLRHRIQLSAEKELQGESIKAVINNMIKIIEVPR